MRISGSHGRCAFNFVRTKNLFPWWLYHFTPLTVYGSYSCSTDSSILGIIVLFRFSYSLIIISFKKIIKGHTLDSLSFHRTSFCLFCKCSRIYLRIPYYIQLTYLLRLILAVTVPQTLFLTLTVLSSVRNFVEGSSFGICLVLSR